MEPSGARNFSYDHMPHNSFAVAATAGETPCNPAAWGNAWSLSADDFRFTIPVNRTSQFRLPGAPWMWLVAGVSEYELGGGTGGNAVFLFGWAVNKTTSMNNPFGFALLHSVVVRVDADPGLDPSAWAYNVTVVPNTGA